LNIFYGAAQRLVSLENLYSKPYSAEGWQLYYYYSPLFATLLAPFTFLPQFVVTHEVPFWIVYSKNPLELLKSILCLSVVSVCKGFG
jgi:hypothetical protein